MKKELFNWADGKKNLAVFVFPKEYIEDILSNVKTMILKDGRIIEVKGLPNEIKIVDVSKHRGMYKVTLEGDTLPETYPYAEPIMISPTITDLQGQGYVIDFSG